MMVEPTGAIEERVVDLCNRLAEGLGVDVEQISAEPFVAILTGALQASGLRRVVCDNPGAADGSGD